MTESSVSSIHNDQGAHASNVYKLKIAGESRILARTVSVPRRIRFSSGNRCYSCKDRSIVVGSTRIMKRECKMAENLILRSCEWLNLKCLQRRCSPFDPWRRFQDFGIERRSAYHPRGRIGLRKIQRSISLCYLEQFRVREQRFYYDD